ncbi:MAG: copper-binding protein [Candidatus Neomarinimicrobiota bacterium]
MRKTLIIHAFLFICCGVDQAIYPVKGTIRSISNHKNRVTIAHDTIPGLMMPMVMPFPVIDQNELSQLTIGDSVHFEFVWSETLSHARKFSVIGQGHIPMDDDFFKDSYSEIDIGDIFDDVTLLSIDSNKVKLSESDGRYRFISYIFTRCPMPTMCPAVIMKNKYLLDQFSKVDQLDFILVSFDYKYDTPFVLKQNYGSMMQLYDNLDIWSSCNHVEDVYSLVKQSGGDFWGIDEEKIGHTLRSVLLSPNRELLASWKGEDWKVKEVELGIKMLMK